MTVRLSGAMLLYVSDGGMASPRVIAALEKMETQILYGRQNGKSTAFRDIATPIEPRSASKVEIWLDEIESIPYRKAIHMLDKPAREHPVETKQQRVARLRGTRW